MPAIFPSHGRFADASFADALARIQAERISGVLTAARETVIKKIVLQDGRIVFCGSNDPRELVGQYFIKAGLISEADLREAMVLQARDPRPLGRVLQALSKVTPDQVERVMLKKFRETVLDLFIWDDKGRWQLEAQPSSEGTTAATYPLDIPPLLEQGRKRAQRWAELKMLFKTERVSFEVDETRFPAGFPATPGDRKLIELAAIGRTLGEIRAELPGQDFGIYVKFAEFLKMKVLSMEEPTSGAPPPLAEIAGPIPLPPADPVVAGPSLDGDLSRILSDIEKESADGAGDGEEELPPPPARPSFGGGRGSNLAYAAEPEQKPNVIPFRKPTPAPAPVPPVAAPAPAPDPAPVKPAPIPAASASSFVDDRFAPPMPIVETPHVSVQLPPAWGMPPAATFTPSSGATPWGKLPPPTAPVPAPAQPPVVSAPVQRDAELDLEPAPSANERPLALETERPRSFERTTQRSPFVDRPAPRPAAPVPAPSPVAVAAPSNARPGGRVTIVAIASSVVTLGVVAGALHFMGVSIAIGGAGVQPAPAAIAIETPALPVAVAATATPALPTIPEATVAPTVASIATPVAVAAVAAVPTKPAPTEKPAPPKKEEASPAEKKAQAKALAEKGLAKLDAGDAGKAISLFKQALAADPNHAQAHLGLGTALMLNGDNAGAKKALKKFLAIAPNDPLAGQARQLLESL